MDEESKDGYMDDILVSLQILSKTRDEWMHRVKATWMIFQYPYGGEMDVESKGGYMDDMDLPTERTNVTPPPEYTPPEDPPLVSTFL